MNTKFILMLLMCLNFMTILFAYADYETGNEQITVDYYMISWMVDTSDLDVSDLSTIRDNGGVVLNSTFADATEGMRQEQAAGAAQEGGFFSILDTAKMILALFSLLTPLPAIAYFGTVGLPYFWSLFLGAIIGILYLLGLMEFLKGSNL